MEALPELDGWTLVEKLGAGGMCFVYRGHRTGDPTDEHALKLLVDTHEDSRARFLAEGRLLATLSHPNLLTVEEVIPSTPPWLVLELLTGRDLAAHRDAGDPLAPERVASWIADVADGLQAAHDAGIVHRDIKPANILLGQDGRPRLIDFGVARDTSIAHQTRAGVVMGTASYLPPEVFLEQDAKHLQDSPRADVYALGQTLTELLIGRPIHRSEDLQGPHMLVHILRDKMDRPSLDPSTWNPDVPEGLAAIARRATDQDPERRTATARELAAELRAWVEDRQRTVPAPVSRAPSALPAPPASAVEGRKPPPRQRRSPLMWAVGALGATGAGLAVVLGLGFIGLGLLWWARPDPVVRQIQEALVQNATRQQTHLAGCVQEHEQGSLTLTLHEGAPVTVDATGWSERSAACLRDLAISWSYPALSGTAGIRLELHPAP